MTTSTNPFAKDAIEIDRFNEEQAERDRRNQAAKAHAEELRRLNKAIPDFVFKLTESLRRDFRTNRTLWRHGAQALAAGDYLVYLTTRLRDEKGEVALKPAVPAISPEHARVVRNNFVWQLLKSDNTWLSIPYGTLVGQTEDWFPELLAAKGIEYDGYKKRQADKTKPCLQEEENEDDVQAEDAPTPTEIDPKGKLAYSTSSPLRPAFTTSGKVGKQTAA